MPHTVWVANGKGGVGKSVLMMSLAAFYAAADAPLTLIDTDDKANLAEFMGAEQVLSLKVGASAEELRTNPSLAYSHWDRLAIEIVERDTGVDFGANMDRPILDWAATSNLAALFAEADVTMDFYAPITADPLAMAGGLEVLSRVEQVFPNARRIMVLNKSRGGFEAYARTREFDRIVAMKDRGLQVIQMEACVSEAWSDFERLKLPPHRVMSLDARGVAQLTGLGIPAARRARSDYAAWLACLRANLTFVLPRATGLTGARAA